MTLNQQDSDDRSMIEFLQFMKSDPVTREALRLVTAEIAIQSSDEDILVAARNAKVFSDLGKLPAIPNVAVFYGAAHMPSLEYRLIVERHFREGKEIWLPAIHADESKVTGSGVEVLKELRKVLTTG